MTGNPGKLELAAESQRDYIAFVFNVSPLILG